VGERRDGNTFPLLPAVFVFPHLLNDDLYIGILTTSVPCTLIDDALSETIIFVSVFSSQRHTKTKIKNFTVKKNKKCPTVFVPVWDEQGSRGRGRGRARLLRSSTHAPPPRPPPRFAGAPCSWRRSSRQWRTGRCRLAKRGRPGSLQSRWAQPPWGVEGNI
jgi:hypothetical protein